MSEESDEAVDDEVTDAAAERSGEDLEPSPAADDAPDTGAVNEFQEDPIEDNAEFAEPEDTAEPDGEDPVDSDEESALAMH